LADRRLSPSSSRTRSRDPESPASGFSLLEVLVAFAILSISLGVLLQVFATGLRNAGVADDYTRATLYAESIWPPSAGKRRSPRATIPVRSTTSFPGAARSDPYTDEYAGSRKNQSSGLSGQVEVFWPVCANPFRGAGNAAPGAGRTAGRTAMMALSPGRARPQANAGSGFTLLELVVAITLMGLVLVVLYSGFAAGLNGWDSGEQRAEASNRLRLVQEFLRRQLAQSMTVYRTNDQQGKVVVFAGQPTASNLWRRC
jgi:prepilin-type N-terminal cleavage/methylation domain-containing protein